MKKKYLLWAPLQVVLVTAHFVGRGHRSEIRIYMDSWSIANGLTGWSVAWKKQYRKKKQEGVRKWHVDGYVRVGPPSVMVLYCISFPPQNIC